ncbi:MAG: hypothetical protein AAGE52_33120 [Myxococcota bacterium]
MNKLLTIITLCSPFLLAGCNGALIGQMVVLMITVGIFFGTLSLGKASEAARSRADGSATSTAGRS